MNDFFFLICYCGFIQVAATGSVIGHLANPLLVLPLKPAMAADSSSAPKSVVPDKMSNLVGAGYQAFEDSVLKKLQKVCHMLVHFSRLAFLPYVISSVDFTDYYLIELKHGTIFLTTFVSGSIWI